MENDEDYRKMLRKLMNRENLLWKKNSIKNKGSNNAQFTYSWKWVGPILIGQHPELYHCGIEEAGRYLSVYVEYRLTPRNGLLTHPHRPDLKVVLFDLLISLSSFQYITTPATCVVTPRCSVDWIAGWWGAALLPVLLLNESIHRDH